MDDMTGWGGDGGTAHTARERGRGHGQRTMIGGWVAPNFDEEEAHEEGRPIASLNDASLPLTTWSITLALRLGGQ